MNQCEFNVNAYLFFFNLKFKVANFACFFFNVAGNLKVLPILKINHINNLFILI